MALAAAACSSDGEDTPTTTATATTTTLPQSVETDGQLVVGLLVPPNDSLIADSVQNAVATARDRINAAGGVLGEQVTVVVTSEGDTPAAASTAIQTLLEADVDAIIGPASSPIALNVLDEIVASGTVACSPTASALALDEFPDDGLFFRTIPSDSLQALAIANAASRTGERFAAVVYVDDAYGRDFADAVTAALELQPGEISVVESIPFGADDDLDDEIDRLNSSDAQVAIVLANGDDGTTFLAALDDGGADDLTTVFVNDAMRDPTSPQRIQELDPDLRERIVGIAPQAEAPPSNTPFDPPGLFAANAYDCVNLIALAAAAAESDAPRDIAEQISLVSFSGSPCRTFAECVEHLNNGRTIDYDGPTGLTEISTEGDPSRANFDQFDFDETGADRYLRTTRDISS